MTWTMPTAPTPSVASPALVSLDSLVMELTAQVIGGEHERAPHLFVQQKFVCPLWSMEHVCEI